jgi:hypothetical protein
MKNGGKMLDEFNNLKDKVLNHPLADSYVIKSSVRKISIMFQSHLSGDDFHSAFDCLVQLQEIYNSMEDLMRSLGERNDISYEEFIQKFDLVEEDTLYT